MILRKNQLLKKSNIGGISQVKMVLGLWNETSFWHKTCDLNKYIKYIKPVSGFLINVIPLDF